MKADIHPEYNETTIACACGTVYHTRSTKRDIKIGICAACHPFFTGEQKFVDTAGRIEKFSRRYGTACSTPQEERLASQPPDFETVKAPRASSPFCFFRGCSPMPTSLAPDFISMDFASLIARKTERFRELEAEIASGISTTNREAREGDPARAHALKELLAHWEQLQKVARRTGREPGARQGDDAEMAEMAQAEIPELEKRDRRLSSAKVQFALLPPDPNEDRDAIVEIRAGTGGDEAALFAADLYRMYTRYAETHGLKIETLESSAGELGGLKEVIFKVSGDRCFRTLRYESGVHRVQRVPATEAQGRIHTTTATVAVLPEAEEVDLELKPDEIRIEVCRAGGPGGQGVNTTDSAVQVMHIPTGTIVRCQDGRSQQKNKEKALTILRSRLLEEKQREEAEKYAAHRKSQIGSGDRERKNPHLQLPAEPRHRSPHRTDALQSRPVHGRRHRGDDQGAPGRGYAGAAGRSEPRGCFDDLRLRRELLFDALFQHRRADGLAEEGIAADLLRALARITRRHDRGEKDDGDVLQARVFRELGGEVAAISPGMMTSSKMRSGWNSRAVATACCESFSVRMSYFGSAIFISRVKPDSSSTTRIFFLA